MDLDRGVLERIDRKLLAGLGQDETYRMVRLPVTASKWSTCRRYCDSAGISMGRAITKLIDRELTGVFGDHTGEHTPIFAEQAEVELAIRLGVAAEALSYVGERHRKREHNAGVSVAGPFAPGDRWFEGT